jgi:UDP-N-acetylglucosamine 2-epimerase (non-hydrolysing)
MPDMTILSVVGARPNFMKVAPLHRVFTRLAERDGSVLHKIVHTGQHYDAAMSDAFFRDLALPEPSYFLGVGSGSHAEQTARVMVAFEKVCLAEKPALVIVVGDVNSTIACTLTAKKLGIRVAHVEAGLRSFDRTMPEELNRIATDALCDAAFVTEQSGVENLLREGWSDRAAHVHLVGNTMIDSLRFTQEHALPASLSATLIQGFGLQPQGYVLATLHRPSNVDDSTQLQGLLELLLATAEERGVKIVFPVHPRTRKNLEQFGLMPLVTESARMQILEPQGYVHFLALMTHARLVMTDSGGVQEETTALGVPCLTLRTTTERPITCELGTNILVAPEPENIRRALRNVFLQPAKQSSVPPLWDGHAAERIVRIIVEQYLS